MDALKVQVEDNKQDIVEVKQEIKEIKQSMNDLEDRIERRMEKHQQELKLLFKEQELNSKEKNTKVFGTLDSIRDSMHEQQLKMLEFNQSLKETNNYIKEVQDKNKWLSRSVTVAAIGFIGTFVNALIQTYFM